MSIQQRMRELGIELPPPAQPVGAYLPALRTEKLIFTSGQLPMLRGTLVASGKVGTEVSLEKAQAAARQAVINALAAVQEVAGSLDQVTRIVRVNCFVNSAAGFTDQAKVANTASELLQSIFGERGRHTRCAVGVAELPLNACVELDIVVETL